MTEKEGNYWVWASKDRSKTLELFAEKGLGTDYCLPQMMAFCLENGLIDPELVRIYKGKCKEIG